MEKRPVQPTLVQTSSSGEDVTMNGDTPAVWVAALASFTRHWWRTSVFEVHDEQEPSCAPL